MSALKQSRRFALLGASVALLIGVAWGLLQLKSAPRSDLAATAHAYSVLGQSLEHAGLLPFPSDLKSLLSSPALRGPHAPTLMNSTDSTGEPVYQFGSVLTVMTRQGHTERYLFSTQRADEFGATPVSRALKQLATLPLSRQQTVQVGNTGGLPMHNQPFFFDYSSNGRSWRLTPQFEGEKCVRVDIVQL